MRYVFTTKLVSVEEKFRTIRAKKVGDQVQEETESLGWFLRLSESSAICVGAEKPDLAAGDLVTLTIEKFTS